ncbi:MAG: alginate lyase family protein [Bacteroidetes bacterium]|nr:alginate lyase family protein [Bacteroidota bacterium]
MRYIFFFFVLAAAAPVRAQYVGLNAKEIKLLKRLINKDTSVGKAYGSMVRTAEQALGEAPHPIDTIRTEGLLQGDPKKTATQASLRDMNKIYALALVYRVQGDRRYLAKAKEFLLAWAGTNHPKGDPIDDTNLDRVIEGYDMIKGELGSGENTLIQDWLRVTAQTELHSRYYHPDRPSFYNNWHSHRLKVVGEIAFAIGDTALQNYTITALKEQLAKNLNPDGSSIDFTSRDALHYHVYDLEPLLKLIYVLKRATGVDYYAFQASNGASIRQSVDWLLPYLNGQKTHAEFVNSTVDFDRKRAQNNEAAYKAGTLFETKNGIGTLVLAVYFDEGLKPLAGQLMAAEGAAPWQEVVIRLGQGRG